MKQAVRHILIMTLLLISAAISCDGAGNAPITVSASVDSSSVYIGDRVTYTIDVRADEDLEVEMPSFGEPLGGFSIIDYESEEGGLFGTRTLRQKYILDTYETGSYTIPPAVVKYRTKGSGDWLEIKTDEIKIEVKSLLESEDGGPAAIKDIRGPVAEFDLLYLYIAGAVATAVIIVAIVIIYIRRRRRKPAPSEPATPAHETALKALRELRSRGYLKDGRFREFYFELSGIVRHYLEDRFSIRAPEMTTEEFLRHLKETSILDSEQKGMLREFLFHCDMVKFAKYSPRTEEAERSMDSARRLIEQTADRAVAGGV
jgi:hypothetical protein